MPVRPSHACMTRAPQCLSGFSIGTELGVPSSKVRHTHSIGCLFKLLGWLTAPRSYPPWMIGHPRWMIGRRCIVIACWKAYVQRHQTKSMLPSSLEPSIQQRHHSLYSIATCTCQRIPLTSLSVSSLKQAAHAIADWRRVGSTDSTTTYSDQGWAEMLRPNRELATLI